jgi:hypothetical protein
MAGMEIDHIICGVADLVAGIGAMEDLLGVRAAMGGKHLGLGTHNALLSLGGGAYLEIIAPDPEQPNPSRPLPWGLAALREPRLLTWAVKAPDIEAQAERAKAAGVDVGPVLRMSRERPDGTRLEWALTFREQPLGDGLVPFLIAWEPGPHPSETSPGGCRLGSLRGEHPEADRIAGMLAAVGVEMEVSRGERPMLIATVEGGRGVVELR